MTKKTVAGKQPEGSEKNGSPGVDSLSADLYETIEQIAKQKKVSVAWVVRDAAEKYTAEQRQG